MLNNYSFEHKVVMECATRKQEGIMKRWLHDNSTAGWSIRLLKRRVRGSPGRRETRDYEFQFESEVDAVMFKLMF